MKKNKRKLTLGKETLRQVTGGGPLTIGPPNLTPVCPIVLPSKTCPPCSVITCGYRNTCAPWGCQSDVPVTC